MPVLETESGQKIDVTPPDADAINHAFDSAMNEDGPDEQAPPKRQPRSEAPARSAPRRGRPPKEEKARTTPEPAPKDDYTDDAQAAVGGLWAVTASIPFTQPYALVIEGNSDTLVSALAEGAKHNATVRKFISSGGNTWAIQLASVGVTMGMQTMQLMKDPELRKEAAATTREHLKAAMKTKGIAVPEPAHEPAAA